MEGVETLDYYGYSGCIALQNGGARVVLGRHCGGRVLGTPGEARTPCTLTRGKPAGHTPQGAGRKPRRRSLRHRSGAHYPRHPTLWLGPWTAEAIGPRQARLTSEDDAATGMRLIREFRLDAGTSRLTFTQTMVNVSRGDDALVPLEPHVRPPRGHRRGAPDSGSRFPKDYVMYGPGPVINFRPEDESVRRRGEHLVIRGCRSSRSWVSIRMALAGLPHARRSAVPEAIPHLPRPRLQRDRRP